MSRIDRMICHVMPRAFLMALVAEGRLVELQIARRDAVSLVEGIFLGRVERVMSELDAAFVDIGVGRSGFLRADDRAGIEGWPPPGAPVLVQVRADNPGGDKGPRLSMNVAISGRYLVYHPMGSGVSFSRRIEGEAERERLAGHIAPLLEGGVILRTAAAGVGPDEPLRVANEPDDVMIVVTGGVGIKAAYMPTWGGTTKAVSRLIRERR